MQSVNISNHPEVENIKRKATRHSLLIDDSSKTVVLVLRVEHFKDIITPSLIEGEPDIVEERKLTTVNDVYPILRVDNNTMVDVQGNIVENDSPDAIMTEWHFFSEILGNMPIIIDQMVASKIAWADNLGKLNNFY